MVTPARQHAADILRVGLVVILMIFVLGLWPKPFLDRLAPSVERLAATVAKEGT